jgi:nucleotide-binding universal stress UspA family protein
LEDYPFKFFVLRLARDVPYEGKRMGNTDTYFTPIIRKMRSFMKINALRRWSRPKVVLIISTLTENPAHTLRVVNGFRNTAAKLFLVQLPTVSFTPMLPHPGLPFLVGAHPQAAEERSFYGVGQAFLWAEILSEVTVLKNMPLQRMPALADSLGADLVVLTSPEIARRPFRLANAVDVDLFGILPVPMMICGPRMAMSSWNGRDVRNILVPVSFGSSNGLQMRFACRFARRHHGRLTVLHVFPNLNGGLHAWERTREAVETRLPISELKQEGILCPIEIVISEGYADRKILAFNEQRPHNLIVMGGPEGRGFPKRYGFSVTESVIASARCPVLVLGTAAVDAVSEVAEIGPQLSLA